VCVFACEICLVYSTALVLLPICVPSFVTSAFASHSGHLRTSGMVDVIVQMDGCFFLSWEKKQSLRDKCCFLF
jgi:hypothetical protein